MFYEDITLLAIIYDYAYWVANLPSGPRHPKCNGWSWSRSLYIHGSAFWLEDLEHETAHWVLWAVTHPHTGPDQCCLTSWLRPVCTVQHSSAPIKAWFAYNFLMPCQIRMLLGDMIVYLWETFSCVAIF